MPATIGTCGLERADELEHLEHPLLVPVRGVDHQYVDADVEQRLRLLLGVAVDPDRGRDPELAVRIEGRLVERGPERALAGEDADDRAVGVHHGREPVPAVVQLVERRPRRRSRPARVSSSRDMIPSSWVNRSTPAAVRLGHHPDRPAVVDHDHRAVTALGQQVQRLADGPGRRQHERGVVHRVPLL